MARKRQCAHWGSELWAREDEEDHLLHMDPSLMTERQQMAFLLRTTAQERCIGSYSIDEDSENEAVTSKKSKWLHQEQHEATATLTHRGHHRLLKTKKKRAGDIKLRRKMSKKNKASYEEHKVDAKPSPTGSDNVSRLDAAAPQCALCCNYDTVHETSFSDVLFLCPACDRKYPTQQALGRRACMI